MGLGFRALQRPVRTPFRYERASAKDLQYRYVEGSIRWLPSRLRPGPQQLEKDSLKRDPKP